MPLYHARIYNDLDDPPFYLRQKSSSDEDSGYPISSLQSQTQGPKTFMTTLPLRPGLSRGNSAESGSEDFRSVIDDLTVENKKLKRKLRKLERLHCSQLQEDKLFEIRFHRLPTSKRRELESTLRDFISRLDQSHELSSNVRHIPNPYINSVYPPPIHKLSSISTSFSRPVDSAYASMSASGQTSTSRLHHPEKLKTSEPQQSLDQNIKSYLHDIPQGLLPREAPFMTERVKTKLVVRRLEQLFTGKGANAAHTSHSLQQQQISHSAAKDERTLNQAKGREASFEGNREARILPVDSGNGSEMCKEPRVCAKLPTADDGDDYDSSLLNTSGDGTPDQRPTRPLDLDPHRAQIPSENIEYIRHLGLALPSLNPDSNTYGGDGWVYLNLLMGMAQLHTINVTVDFVRKAIKNVSEKLELSEDAQKIRWKGGSQGTHMSSDSESSPDITDRPLTEPVRYKSDYHRGSRRCGNLGLPSRDSSGIDFTNCPRDRSSTSFGAKSVRRPIFLGQFHGNSRLDYEPLFFHGTRLEEEDDYYLNDGDSLMPSVLAADVPCAVGNVNETRACDTVPLSLERKGEEGPMIFYNRAKFCTDLSGDTNITPCDATEYSKFVHDAVGYRPPTVNLSEEAKESLSSILGKQTTNTVDCSIDFALDWSVYNCNSMKEETEHRAASTKDMLMPFPASGVGGVQPADHFTIHVDVRHWSNAGRLSTQLPQLPLDATQRCKASLRDPFKDTNMPRSAYNPTSKVTSLHSKSEIIGATKTVLGPSSLPSPSHVVLPSSLMDSVFDDIDSLDFDEAQSAVYSHLKNVGRSGNSVSISSPVRRVLLESSSTTSDVSSDDSSMDLLAHAREMDPDTIAAREREFEDHAFQMAAISQEESGTHIMYAGGSTASTEGSGGTLSSEMNDSAIDSCSLKRERSADGVYLSNKKARISFE